MNERKRPMEISSNLIELVAAFEQFRAEAYLCPGGVWTLGYGSTRIPSEERSDSVDQLQPALRAVREGDTCTVEEAATWLANDLRNAREIVLKNLNFLPEPHVLDALTSFTQNLGWRGWYKDAELTKPSGLRTILRADTPLPRKLELAAVKMKEFINARDKRTGKLRPLAGLRSRRERETDILLNGWLENDAGSEHGEITEIEPSVLKSTTGKIATAGLGATLLAGVPLILQSYSASYTEYVDVPINELLVQVIGPAVAFIAVILRKRFELNVLGSFGSQGNSR